MVEIGVRVESSLMAKIRISRGSCVSCTRRRAHLIHTTVRTQARLNSDARSKGGQLRKRRRWRMREGEGEVR